MTRLNLAVRSLLALILVTLFYLLAVASVVGLAYLGYHLVLLLPDIRAGRGTLGLLLAAAACVVAAGVIAWSVIPRIDRFEPPGPELTKIDAPGLFTEIQHIARKTDQKFPRHVYLVSEVNAFVTERGGVMGIGSQRVMGIGLPLLQLLNVSELRGVLAHEFGHFYGGDTKLGPWIYKTRSAMGRTITNLSSAGGDSDDLNAFTVVLKIVHKPFLWFGLLFLRVSQAISRAQEYSADALAARITGPGPMIEGLKKVSVGSAAYNAYLNDEVGPLVDAGYHPPILDGFSHFLGQDNIREILARHLEAELHSAERDAYDSHPVLQDRITALQDKPTANQPLDVRPARELLGDVQTLEGKLLHFGSERSKLRPIEWSDAVSQVMVPSWRESVTRHAEILSPFTPTTLPRSREGLSRLAEKQLGHDVHGVELEVLRGWACAIYGSALAVLLLDLGHAATAPVGRAVQFDVDGTPYEPFTELRRFLDGHIDEETWAAFWRGRGLADHDLSASARHT